MFLRRSSIGLRMLLVYVDDIIIIGNSSYNMKVFRPLTCFPGLEVHTIKKDIFINQHEHTINLTNMAQLKVSHPVDIPLEVNVKYMKYDSNSLSVQTVY